MEPPPPDVPDDRLRDGGWEHSGDRTETLLAGPPVRVLGRTVVYTDGDGTDGADDPEQESVAIERFFFASRLDFRPPLPPVTGAASVRPVVLSAAGQAFAADLRERGLEDVRRERRERMRVDTGERATLLAYRADRPRSGESVPVAGLLAAWVRDGEFRIAGGAYPEGGPGGDERGRYRDELLDLMAAVG
jgi:hypothetical protein